MDPLDLRTDRCLKDSLPGDMGSSSIPFICVCRGDEIVALGEGRALQQAAGRSAEAYRQGGHSVPADFGHLVVVYFNESRFFMN